MCVCMYRGRISWNCPWNRVIQLSLREGPIGIVGPMSQPRGAIDTASCAGSNLRTQCAFSEPALLWAAKSVLYPHVGGKQECVSPIQVFSLHLWSFLSGGTFCRRLSNGRDFVTDQIGLVYDQESGLRLFRDYLNRISQNGRIKTSFIYYNTARNGEPVLRESLKG